MGGVDPGSVIPSGRKAAWLVFMLLFAGFVAYSVWTVYNAIKKRDDPPTQAKLVKQFYVFPYIYLCPNDDFPQTSWDIHSARCLPTATPLKGNLGTPPGGGTYCPLPDPENLDQTVPDGCVEYVPDVTSDCGAELVQKLGKPCVKFNTDHNVTLTSRKDSIDLYIAFNYTADLEAYVVEGVTVPQRLSKNLDAFLSDSPTDELYDSAPDIIPFPGTTTVSVQRTTYQFLDKSKNRVEYSSSIASAGLLQLGTDSETLTFNGTIATGATDVLISIRLDSLVVEDVSESDPVDPNVLVGVISGFWGFVGMAWGFLFVPRDKEELKPLWFSEKKVKADEEPEKPAANAAPAASAPPATEMASIATS